MEFLYHFPVLSLLMITVCLTLPAIQNMRSASCTTTTMFVISYFDRSMFSISLLDLFTSIGDKSLHSSLVGYFFSNQRTEEAPVTRNFSGKFGIGNSDSGSEDCEVLGIAGKASLDSCENLNR